MTSTANPPPPEPRNPFYLVLQLVSVAFVITTLAVAVVPILEKKAAEAGDPPPPSAFRDYLRSDGWQLILILVGAMIFFAVASMGLDRLRRLQKERAVSTIPEADKQSHSSV